MGTNGSIATWARMLLGGLGSRDRFEGVGARDQFVSLMLILWLKRERDRSSVWEVLEAADGGRLFCAEEASATLLPARLESELAPLELA